MNTVEERYLGTVEMAEAPYMTAKTSVWWDIENCQIPRGFDAHGIAHNICSALMKMNYFSPVSIYAYGDVNGIPPTIQHALSSTGIVLNHVPAGNIHLKPLTYSCFLCLMLFMYLDMLMFESCYCGKFGENLSSMIISLQFILVSLEKIFYICVYFVM